MGSVPRLGRFPGRGNGNPVCILAWIISWTEEPGGLQSMGSERVRHNWATEWVKVYLKAPAGVTSQKKDTCLLWPEGISLLHLCALKDHWILRFSFISYCLTASGSFSSVQFSHIVLSDSLQPHGPQHARLPCPSPTPRVYSNSCPLSRWCHPTISSSLVPFSCLQSFPESGSFQMSQLFASGGQSIRASASTSVLPMNIQDWFPLGWTGCRSLQSKGLSRVLFNTTVQKHQFFWNLRLTFSSSWHICS